MDWNGRRVGLMELVSQMGWRIGRDREDGVLCEQCRLSALRMCMAVLGWRMLIGHRGEGVRMVGVAMRPLKR